MKLMLMGWVIRRGGRCLIAQYLLVSEILADLGWVLFVGIFEEGDGSDSEYRVKAERECQFLGWTLHHYRHRSLTKLAGWVDFVGPSSWTMTFVRVVLLVVRLWHCTYQGRCSAVVEQVMSEVGRFRSHHWIGEWAVFTFPDLHQW